MIRLILFLLILGGIGYWYWTTTPEYSIEQIRNSVKEHDLSKFEKYVEMDSVASGLVDDFIGAPMKHLLGTSILGQWVASGIVGFIKPEMAANMKQQISHFVETGEFDRDKEEEPELFNSPIINRNQISLLRLDSKLGFRKHAFKRVQYDHKSGKLCNLGLLFHNQLYDEDLLLDVKMRQVDGAWKLIEVSNLPTFMGRIVELETKRQSKTLPALSNDKPPDSL